AASPAYERPPQAIVLRPQVPHRPVAFRAAKRVIPQGREFRRDADVATSKMMKEAIARQIRATTTGADFSDIQVMAVASRTQADPVEESGLQIASFEETGQILFEVVAGEGIAVAVLTVRVRQGRQR